MVFSVVAGMAAVAVTETMAVAVTGTTAGMAVAVTSRKDLARDRNLPAADRTQNPVLVRIPGLNPGSSRDLLVGMALPVAAKRKETDFVLPLHQKRREGPRVGLFLFIARRIP